jgi:hypothetical protein
MPSPFRLLMGSNNTPSSVIVRSSRLGARLSFRDSDTSDVITVPPSQAENILQAWREVDRLALPNGASPDIPFAVPSLRASGCLTRLHRVKSQGYRLEIYLYDSMRVYACKLSYGQATRLRKLLRQIGYRGEGCPT